MLTLLEYNFDFNYGTPYVFNQAYLMNYREAIHKQMVECNGGDPTSEEVVSAHDYYKALHDHF